MGDLAYAMIMTACGSQENARLIAKSLVEQKLAACSQIFPIQSFFEWEGKVQESAELMVFCKIKSADYALVEAAIIQLHEYQVPEIVLVPINQGLPAYLDWIKSVTR